MNDRIKSCNEIAGEAPDNFRASNAEVIQPPTNDKDRNELIQDCAQLQAQLDRLQAEYETLKVLVEIGRDAIGERNAAEHSLAEATRLLEAYGGGVSEVEEWLRAQ